MLDGILLEKAGIPSVTIVTEAFVETGNVMACDWGVPAYRSVTVPHPIANLSDGKLEERADELLSDVVKLLKEGQEN